MKFENLSEQDSEQNSNNEKLSFLKLSPGNSYNLRIVADELQIRNSVSKWSNGKSLWNCNLSADEYKTVKEKTKLTNLNFSEELLIPVLDLSDGKSKILTSNKKTFKRALGEFVKAHGQVNNINLTVKVGTAPSKTGSVYHVFEISKMEDQTVSAEAQNVVSNYPLEVLETIVNKTTKSLDGFREETGISLI